MDDAQEGLNEIDRALAAALDVAPPVDFAARVRQRIAREPKRAPRWRGWPIAVPAAAAAALVFGAAVVTWSNGASPAPHVLAARPIPLEPLRPAAVRPARFVTPLAPLVSSRGSRATVVSVPSTAGPEILVPPADVDMYRRLIALAQHLPPAVMHDGPKNLVATGTILDITIDPIRIDLIAPRLSGEGDRQ